MRRVVPLLLLVLLLPAPVTASAQGGEYESRIRLNLYAPVTIRLEYAYTRNATVGDVSSLGPSLYEVTHSPVEFRFEAGDIDAYTFTVELSYGVRTHQNIRLTIFSGSLLPSTIELPVEAEALALRFEVTVQQEPVYPSVEEITENIVTHMTGQMEIYQAENQRTYRLINEGLTGYSYLVALVVVALIILIIVVYRSIQGGRQ